jgi:hypothetical protein
MEGLDRRSCQNFYFQTVEELRRSGMRYSVRCIPQRTANG